MVSAARKARLARRAGGQGTALHLKPVITGTAEIRRASSACYGAKLNPGTEPETFTCRECGKPCERVMSEPEVVTLHG